MKSQDEVLCFVAARLEQCSIAYMIVGSFASNLHGKPRTTHDADLVVEIDAPRLEKFAQALGDDFYFDVEAARDAIKKNIMSNVLHYESGLKIDLIVRKNRAFSRSEFQRRFQDDFLGRPCWIATAEDTLLAKLEWSKMGASERQYEDAVNIAKVQGEKLELGYVRTWAPELQVDDLLHRLLAEVQSGS